MADGSIMSFCKSWLVVLAIPMMSNVPSSFNV
nr:MAG TPA: hypothetical protein [Caudoviricetes sp.]